MGPPPSPRPLHVGMVSPTLPGPGRNQTGSPAHIRKTRSALERQGVTVTSFELDVEGGSALRLPRVVARLARELSAARPDVLHVHGHISAGLALVPAAGLRLPVVVEIHGLYVPSRPGGNARPWLSRAAHAAEIPVLRRARALVVQARAMRDRLVACGVPAERITVLYPGLRTAEFTEYAGPPAELPGARPGERVVLYVGSTHRYQGLDLLAAAQRHLARPHRLVLVTSSDTGAREDVVARFGFDPDCTLVVEPSGPEVLPAWCRRADVLVHARPDVPDNINVQSKLGLYLAAGRPIAATDVGDYPALLGGSGGCVLTPPEPEALARGIAAALAPAVAEAARVENPALARRHFEADTNAKELVAVYLRAMSPRRPAQIDRPEQPAGWGRVDRTP